MSKAIQSYVKTCLALSGKVKKDATNPHFKSGYATLESVLETILPACHENGIVPLQEIIPSENGIAVRTTIYHDSGDSLQLEPCPIPVDKNNAHGTVSASTYGRRVSLMAIFGLAPSDDDGNAATDTRPQKGTTGLELDWKAIDRAIPVLKDAVDGDYEEEERHAKIHIVFDYLNQDEGIETLNGLNDVAPGTKRKYRNIINDYLKQPEAA